ncbi:DUF7373 family lipoprotein [Gordonia hankookensis]|uniref:Uncharacterized protein n=1 Tax=Gordonia hankookensis TaxID=589403 RepID=A0ABR7WC45_9ACTN|nr:hypothetical protein [Gordonia hankookensis]MBD1319319.1 hypothetical protein [Gordonia hankookensis]
MTKWQPVVRWVGVLAAITAIAGCTTQGEATSVSASGAASEPSVDVAALDTGAYPTAPRPAFGKATQDNILQVEGQRMAQFVVVPFEIDDDLTNANMPTMVISGPSNLGMVLAPDTAKVPANKKMLMGFVDAAATPDESLRAGTKRAINNMVLRYLTPADAKDAARQMADATATGDKSRVTTLPGLPDTLVVQGSSGGNKQMMAFTPHNSYVLYQWFETTPSQQNMLEPTVRKALALQSALIDKFPATPTKEEAKARGITGSSAPVVDQNHVLIYALPYTDDEIKKGKAALPGGSIRAVYGPRGMAQMSGDPKTDFTMLTDVGSTANAIEKSTVYRASTPDGAKTIVDTSLTSSRSQGWADAESPVGLPAAKCQSKTLDTGTWYACYVQKGRYVGNYSARDKRDVHQAISAQYVILTKADQNAN